MAYVTTITRIAPLAFLLITACSDPKFLRELDDEAAVQAKVDAALARQDYAGAVATIDGASRYSNEKDIVAGNVILTACRARSPWCTPPHDAVEGVRRLIRVTSSVDGASRLEAAGHLADWYRGGAGPGLRANAATARCWQAASTGRHTPLACYDRD